jgi:protoporphyrinogen IX oxidase
LSGDARNFIPVQRNRKREIPMLADTYLWLKAFHIISLVAWMAGLFYLPRLYAYHAESLPGSEKSETFKVMERRLLRIIMNPAMILTFLFGILMVVAAPDLLRQGWLHAKLGLVVAMAGFHGALAVWRKDFAADRNRKSARFYRMINEVPTLLLIPIVILAVIKPF